MSAQDRPLLFTVDRGGAGETVSADRTGVTCDRALLDLGLALGWRVDFETKQLEAALGDVPLDLALRGQPPRVVAHLLAAAGGADVVFDDRPPGDPVRTRVHVVGTASGDVESGRQRLRQWSIAWYQSFLARGEQLDPLVAEEGIRVRMQLAQMRRLQGDLEGAASAFEAVHSQDENHAQAPLAMLRIAECSYELNKLDVAERWARRVAELHPSRPEMASAAILLGQILLAGGRYDECVRELRGFLLPLADSPHVVDAYLLLAQAQALRARPDEVFRNIEVLAGSRNFKDLSARQFRDYWYLRGLGAEGAGQPAVAMEALELFLGVADDDARRGRALVLLARSYAALSRFLEARASALAAIKQLDGLDKDWRRAAEIVNAKTAIALGDRENAFSKLEVEVRSAGADPELTLFLIDAFHEAKRYQKAVATADLLAKDDSPYGQQARVRKLAAMLEQVKDDRSQLSAFPAQASAIASGLRDEALQRQAAELIGSAYEMLGDVERAADAYRGVLR
jgi:tetratricopeptide (TPR) repeat protein